MERLTVKQIDGTYHIYDNNVIRKADCCDENNKNCFSLYEGNAIDKLGEYEELEEQGILLKLPCKVGDKVYSVECNEIKEFIVSHFDICMKGIYAYQDYIFIGQMGFSVFATKEEAEKALAEMEK